MFSIKALSRALLAIGCVVIQWGCVSLNYTDGASQFIRRNVPIAVVGYSGDFRPIEEVAVVTTDGMLKVVAIDGIPAFKFRILTLTPAGDYGRYQVHLEPGTHELTLSMQGFKYHPYPGTDPLKNAKRRVHIKKGDIMHLSLVKNGVFHDVRATDGRAGLSALTYDFDRLVKDYQSSEHKSFPMDLSLQ